MAGGQTEPSVPPRGCPHDGTLDPAEAGDDVGPHRTGRAPVLRAIEQAGEATEGQRTQRKAKVAKRHVVEARDQQQVHDDAPEPQGDNVSSENRCGVTEAGNMPANTGARY